MSLCGSYIRVPSRVRAAICRVFAVAAIFHQLRRLQQTHRPWSSDLPAFFGPKHHWRWLGQQDGTITTSGGFLAIDYLYWANERSK